MKTNTVNINSKLDRRVGLSLSQLFLLSRILPKLVNLSKLSIIGLLFGYSSIGLAQVNIEKQHINIEKQNAELKNLAKHKQWQHLIFFKNGQTEVISSDFYLSAPKTLEALTSYKELVATINKADDLKVVCQYPARYYWLSNKLNNFEVDLSVCKDLPNPSNDISLILVSSYLKNPASSFGHMLVKTNEVENQHFSSTDTPLVTNNITHNNKKAQFSSVKIASSTDLLSQSYNFGARIPEKENGVLYALKGMFGFYEAGFSQADFFKQDAVYSKAEQRDMWEYVLNLDEFKTALLNYHLYEAQKAHFNYYFIKQNCGYRSGELLELVSDIEITNRLGSWYAPDFIFDQLVEFEQSNLLQHSDDSPSSLIKSIRYLPSEQTQLHQKFQQLPEYLQDIVNDFINSENFTVMSHLDKNDQAFVIDYLIMHRNYKLSQTSDKVDKANHTAINRQLVKQRFNLPVSSRLSELPLSFKKSPANSNKTTRTSVKLSDDKINTAVTLFVKDPLNQYLDINKRFEALKFSGSYSSDEKAQFDEFVFLDMQQIEDVNKSLAGEPMLSWQIKTGVQRDVIDDSKITPYIEAGIGKGMMLTEQGAQIQVLGYGFVNGHVHTQKSYVDISTQLGMRIKDQTNNRAGEIEYSLRLRENKQPLQKTAVTLRQGINKNNDLRMTVSYTDNPNSIADESSDVNLELGFNHYW